MNQKHLFKPNNSGNSNPAPVPVGFDRGAYGQWCAVPQLTGMRHKCMFNTDIISVNGNVECNNAYECCMCEFIECNDCNTLRIGDYGAYGVHDITVYGSAANGATMDCYGAESCRETAVIGTDINQMLCKGSQSCQNAVFIVDVIDFIFECTGIIYIILLI